MNVITAQRPVRRAACPVCGREMVIPVHHNGKPWSPEEIFWVRKFLQGGVARKQVARIMDVSVSQLASMLKKQDEHAGSH